MRSLHPSETKDWRAVLEVGLTRVEVHLANWFFEGARADVSKVISANPAFQLQHSFQLGGQSGKYNFGAIWTNNSVSLAHQKA